MGREGESERERERERVRENRKLLEEEGQVLAVYDLGGGTFDISVLEISGGVFEANFRAVVCLSALSRVVQGFCNGPER